VDHRLHRVHADTEYVVNVSQDILVVCSTVRFDGRLHPDIGIGVRGSSIFHQLEVVGKVCSKSSTSGLQAISCASHDQHFAL
jgi:hypothetical protein